MLIEELNYLNKDRLQHEIKKDVSTYLLSHLESTRVLSVTYSMVDLLRLIKLSLQSMYSDIILYFWKKLIENSKHSLRLLN